MSQSEKVSLDDADGLVTEAAQVLPSIAFRTSLEDNQIGSPLVLQLVV